MKKAFWISIDMNFRNLLEKEHSKSNTSKIVKYIAKHPEALSNLMDCFFDGDIRLCQRAAWPVGDIGEKYPNILLPYLKPMMENISNPKHNAVLRNTLRSWQYLPIPEEFQGVIFDKCYNYFVDVQVPVAIRVFGMTVCANIAKDIPELKKEVIVAIKFQIPFGSAGIKSRGIHLIKMLSST